MRVDLHDDGLLWYINRACFHPRGFALARNSETGEFSLVGDGSEPWRFIGTDLDPAHGVDEDSAFVAVEAAFTRARRANR